MNRRIIYCFFTTGDMTCNLQNRCCSEDVVLSAIRRNKKCLGYLIITLFLGWFGNFVTNNRAFFHEGLLLDGRHVPKLFDGGHTINGMPCLLVLH